MVGRPNHVEAVFCPGAGAGNVSLLFFTLKTFSGFHTRPGISDAIVATRRE